MRTRTTRTTRHTRLSRATSALAAWLAACPCVYSSCESFPERPANGEVGGGGGAGGKVDPSGAAGGSRGGGENGAWLDSGAGGAESETGGTNRTAQPSSGGGPNAGTGNATGTDGGDGGQSPSVPQSTNGRWVGLTSQGRLFDMHVYANAVIDTHFDWTVEGVGPNPNLGCLASTATETSFGFPVEISNSGEFARGPVGGELVTFTISGTVVDLRNARGTIQATYANTRRNQECTGSETIMWNAVHVVCGDGSIDWPETCDDGNQTSDDGCSGLCQLASDAEVEPNDVPAEVDHVYTSTALLTGSLSGAEDVDTYAVKNPHPAPVTVEFETQGQAPGVCGIHTVLRILDETPAIIATNDVGSRALFCSRLSLSLRANQRVYVQVVNAEESESPAYILSVRFQDH